MQSSRRDAAAASLVASAAALLLGLALVLGTGCGTADRADIQRLLDQARNSPTRTIAESDLAGLPAPVQRYLRAAGVVGARQIRAVRARGHGKILFTDSWLPLDTELYETSVPLSRNWLAAGTYMGVGASARDSYCDGEGRMSVRLMEDARFQEGYGPQMDRGQLVTVLADFMHLPTQWLSPAVRWEPVDDRSARAYLTDGAITVQGLVSFDANDDVASVYVDGDRFETVDGEYVARPWTALCLAHGVVGGLRVCTEGAGVWHREDGPQEYVHAYVDEMQFDVFELY